jgi:hypothetical protein
MASTAGPGRPRRWTAGLAWALWLASLLCLAAVPWLDELLRQAGRTDLVQFDPDAGDALTPRSIATARIPRSSYNVYVYALLVQRQLTRSAADQATSR